MGLAWRPSDKDNDAIKLPAGIVCLKCGCADLRPSYRTLMIPDVELPGGGIRRVRFCRHCGAKRVTTER